VTAVSSSVLLTAEPTALCSLLEAVSSCGQLLEQKPYMSQRTDEKQVQRGWGMCPGLSAEDSGAGI
jgi:hypothetical protein